MSIEPESGGELQIVSAHRLLRVFERDRRMAGNQQRDQRKDRVTRRAERPFQACFRRAQAEQGQKAGHVHHDRAERRHGDDAGREGLACDDNPTVGVDGRDAHKATAEDGVESTRASGETDDFTALLQDLVGGSEASGDTFVGCRMERENENELLVVKSGGLEGVLVACEHHLDQKQILNSYVAQNVFYV